MCGLGRDQHGDFFKKDFEELGIRLEAEFFGEKPTGFCLVLVTPDSERTMAAGLGAAGLFSGEHVKEELIAMSRWLLVDGYMFVKPAGLSAVRRALECAESSGCRVALTFSADFVINSRRDEILAALGRAELLFVSRAEATALSGELDWHEALHKLRDLVPGVVITAGSLGALASFEGEEVFAPACVCHAVDTTGAGDMFAGAFMYGITHDLGAAKSAELASRMAALVVGQSGARLGKESFRLNPPWPPETPVSPKAARLPDLDNA